MPHELKFLNKNKYLSFSEILRISKTCVNNLGVNKIRLTGGEPLLRKNICDLIFDLSALNTDLSLTTNGYLLKQYAKDLKAAGLKRINISLDTLDKEEFKIYSGHRGSLEKVLSGINAAVNQEFEEIKINCVLIKNKNSFRNILDLINYFSDFEKNNNLNLTLRFIEFMDVGNSNNWGKDQVVSQQEVLDFLKIKLENYKIKKMKPKYFGEVANNYEIINLENKSNLKTGFISSVSQPFCSSCTRLRLSADGKLFTCLFASKGFDLKEKLRSDLSDLELESLIKNLWENRTDRYSDQREEINNIIKIKSKNNSKIEMQYIGG